MIGILMMQKEGKMGKYYVEMNYVVSYSTKFVIEAPDGDTVYDVLESMDSDFLEENLKWNISDYAEPTIYNLREVGTDPSLDVSEAPEVSKKFYDEFKKTETEVYAD